MTNEELQQLTEQLSLRYFEKNFLHTITFNSRLKTTGGRYMLSSHNIEVNRLYYEEHGLDELIGIIKHELCHYHLHIEGKGYKHRDIDFKVLMKKTGSPRHCTPITKKVTNQKVYTYRCKACAQIYNRKRRVDTKRFVCGKCQGKLEQVI